MISKFFKPLPLLLTIFMTSLVCYSYWQIFASTWVSRQTDYKFEDIKDTDLKIDYKKLKEKINPIHKFAQIEEKYSLQLPVHLEFLKNYQPSEHYFKGSISAEINESKFLLTIKSSYPAKFYNEEGVHLDSKKEIHKIVKDYLRNDIKKLLAQLKQEKLNKTQSLNLLLKEEGIETTEKKTPPDKKNEENKNDIKDKKEPGKNKPGKKEIKPTIEIHLEDLKMIKEFHSKLDKKIRKIEEKLGKLPELGRIPLVMVTSNLAKTYEQKIYEVKLSIKLLEVKKKKRNELKQLMNVYKSLQQKIARENLRLRIEALHIKGQREWNLRQSTKQGDIQYTGNFFRIGNIGFWA